jgi:hypothetical protein
MKRGFELLVLAPIVVALIVNPTMSGGLGVFPTLVCDPWHRGLDGTFCTSLDIWLAVAGILVGALLLVSMALALPFLRRCLRRRAP